MNDAPEDEPDRAADLAMFDEALADARSSADVRSVGVSQALRAKALRDLGRRDEAAQAVAEARACLDPLAAGLDPEERGALIEALCLQAELWRADRLAGSRECTQRALDVLALGATDDEHQPPLVALEHSLTCRLQCDFDAALDAAERARDLLERAQADGDPFAHLLLPFAWSSKALLHIDRAQQEPALEATQCALELGELAVRRGVLPASELAAVWEARGLALLDVLVDAEAAVDAFTAQVEAVETLAPDGGDAERKHVATALGHRSWAHARARLIERALEDHDRAQALCGAARGRLVHGAPVELTCFLARTAALVHRLDGAHDAALAACREGRRSFDASVVTSLPRRAVEFALGQIATQEARSLLELERADEARPVADEAVGRLDDAVAAGFLARELDLAEALHARADVARALEDWSSALRDLEAAGAILERWLGAGRLVGPELARVETSRGLALVATSPPDARRALEAAERRLVAELDAGRRGVLADVFDLAAAWTRAFPEEREHVARAARRSLTALREGALTWLACRRWAVLRRWLPDRLDDAVRELDAAVTAEADQPLP